MDRRGFLGIMFMAAAGAWLGVRGMWKRGAPRLKEAMHYRRLGE